MIKKLTKKYYSPTPRRWRKIATCIKIFLTGLSGVITQDLQQTAVACLIGCLLCDLVVNLCTSRRGGLL